jgi:N-glycosylase/DNA lyase
MLDKKIQASENAVVITGNNSANIYTGPIVNNFVTFNGHAVEVQLHRPFRDLNQTENNDLALLTWQSRLPPQLVGRSIEMQSLLAWANKDKNVSIAVIQGSAGVGKTRLAFELADALYQKGWSAGKLSDPEETIALPESKLGCLLILDYPEEHLSALNQFIEKLSNLPTPPFKLRILLLCRSIDAIASYKLQTLCDQNLYPLRLQALAMQEPFQLLQEVLPSFAKIKNQQLPTISEADFKKWLQLNPNHSSPLLVLVFAISAFYQKNTTQTIAEDLIQNLLQREQQHLITQCKKNNISESKAYGVWLLWQLAAFNGSLTEEELRQLLPQLQLPVYDGIELPNLQELKKLSVWHNSQGLTSIQPDLFAAHALANRSDLKPILTTCIRPLFELGLDKPNSPIAKRLASLTRLHLDWPSTSQYPTKIMVETLAQNLKNEITDELNQAISPHISQAYLPYPLIPLAVVVEKKWVEHFEILAEENFAAYGTHLALSLNNLSVFLRNLGELLQALTTSQLAVNIYEKLALDNFSTYGADLAMSLNNLSNHLSNAGDHQKALTTVQRAVDIHEKIALENFAAYGAGLAMSLNNLSVSLSDVGKHQKALSTIQRAIEIREQLALENFAAYGADLASSLNNLSNSLKVAGDHQKALTTSQRAVEIYEKFALENFAAYGAVLAKSLNNLSNRLKDAGEHQKALTTIQRAVDIYEKLAINNFAAYGADLARSLNNLSVRLSDAGEHQKALITIQRAVDIYEKLALENFAAYGDDLALSLYNLSFRLRDASEHQQALTTILRAVEIREKLALENFADYGAGLAMVLNNLAYRLKDVGEHQQALIAIQRAVDIYEKLALENFAAYGTDLAQSLNNLSNCLHQVGEHQQALIIIQRAINILENLAEKNYAVYGEKLEICRVNLSELLENTQLN